MNCGPLKTIATNSVAFNAVT